MKISNTPTTRLRSGLVSAGAVAALAIGVLGATPAADAAVSGGADYTCGTPLGDITVPVEVSSPALPESVATGFTVPGGMLPAGVTITVPADFAATIKFFGVTAIGGSSGDFDLGLGSVAVPIDALSIAPVEIVDGEDVVLPAKAAVGSFVTPEPGVQALTLPSSFSFDAVNQNNEPVSTLTCALTDPTTAEFGSVSVIKQTSSLNAKAAKKKIKKSERAKITATVVREFGGDATGKVVAAEGKKTLGSSKVKANKATLKLAKLKPGKHKIVLTYLGDSATDGNTAKVTIKVTKKK
ncbi:hypothetical protein BH09ACT12_BH09ACT12_13820 [soil metagenome]